MAASVDDNADGRTTLSRSMNMVVRKDSINTRYWLVRPASVHEPGPSQAPVALRMVDPRRAAVRADNLAATGRYIALMRQHPHPSHLQPEQAVRL